MFYNDFIIYNKKSFGGEKVFFKNYTKYCVDI